ncbi:MAG: phosphate/phosphite/phosphonate ABC transporter substrate-binding protein [Anaerolineae bacterium]
MTRIRLFVTALMLIILVSVSCASPADSPTPALEPETAVVSPDVPAGVIVLADISDEPAKKIERFQPLADYLAANLAEYGIGSSEVKIAPDMETMIQWLQNGEVDLYIDSLYPAMIISGATGAVPTLRRWKKNVAEYHTVFFTLADSGLSSTADLNGRLIAFEEPNSTSGYMLPLAYLVEAGLNPVEKASIEAAVAPDEVGFVFSGDDLNTLQWVVGGTVIAGATDNGNYEELVAESDVELMILAETESVARNVVLMRGDLDPELVTAVSDLLMGLDETEAGLEILDIFKTAQFDEFPGGTENALNRMRELYDLVQNR